MEKKPNVSQVVRSVLPDSMWQPGRSRCRSYVNITYCLTHHLIEWKFTHLKGLSTYSNRQLHALNMKIKYALVKANIYNVHTVYCCQDFVEVCTREPKNKSIV